MQQNLNEDGITNAIKIYADHKRGGLLFQHRGQKDWINVSPSYQSYLCFRVKCTVSNCGCVYCCGCRFGVRCIVVTACKYSCHKFAFKHFVCR